SDADSELGEVTGDAEQAIVLVPVREEESPPIHVEQPSLPRPTHASRHHIVISVDVLVPRAAQAPGDLGVALARRQKGVPRGPRAPRRQRLPDVPEQNDALEVALQEAEKPKELTVVVAEAVRAILRPEVQVRDDRDLHGSARSRPNVTAGARPPVRTGTFSSQFHDRRAHA